MAKTFEEYESGRDTSQDTSFEEYEQRMFRTTPSVALLNDPNDVYIRAVETQDLAVDNEVSLDIAEKGLTTLKEIKKKKNAIGFGYMLDWPSDTLTVRERLNMPDAKTIPFNLGATLYEIPKGLARFFQRGIGGTFGGTVYDWFGQFIMEGGRAVDWISKVGEKDKDRIYNPLAESIIATGRNISRYGKESREWWAYQAATGWEAMDADLRERDPIAYGAGRLSEGVASSALSVLAMYLSGGASATLTTGININRGLLMLSTISAAGGFEHAQNQKENFYWATLHGLADGTTEYAMETTFLAGIGKGTGKLAAGAKEGAEEFFTGMLQNTRAGILENTKTKGMSAYDASKKAIKDSLIQSPWEVASGFIGGFGIAGGSDLVQLIKRSEQVRLPSKEQAQAEILDDYIAKLETAVEKGDIRKAQETVEAKPPPTEVIAAPEKPVAGRKAEIAPVTPEAKLRTSAEGYRLSLEEEKTRVEKMPAVEKLAYWEKKLDDFNEYYRENYPGEKLPSPPKDILEEIRKAKAEIAPVTQPEAIGVEKAVADNLGIEVKTEPTDPANKYEVALGQMSTFTEGDNKLEVWIKETPDQFVLSQIKVEKEGTGLATKFINQLKDYADKTGKKFIMPAPTPTAKKFLDKFDWLEVGALRVDGVAETTLEYTPTAKPEADVKIIEYKDYTEIESIKATPTGKGAGTKAIQELIAKADETGKPIRLGVGRTNTRARALYERLGFKEIPSEDPRVTGITMEYTPAKSEAVEVKKPKKKSKAEVAQAIKEHYTPGNIVYVQYWKQHDRVIEFKETDTGFLVKVQKVEKQDGKWVAVGDVRTHMTSPSRGDKVVERVVPKGKAGKLDVTPLQDAFTAFMNIIEPSKAVEIRLGKDVSATVIKGVHKADVARIEFNEQQIENMDRSLREFGEALGKYPKKVLENLMLSRGKPYSPKAIEIRDKALQDLVKEAPELVGTRKTITRIADFNYKYLTNVVGDEIHYVEDYFYGIYKNPEAVDRFIKHWKTTKRFTKEKKLPTVADAKAFGLDLRDPNPVNNLMSEYMAIARLDGMVEMRDKLMRTGEDKYISKDSEKIVGSEQIPDPVFKGLWVDPDLARMIKNLIATNKITRIRPLNALRIVNNFIREVKFIGSMFHQLAIIKHTMADSGYLGFLYKPTAYRFITTGFKKDDPMFQEDWYKKYIGLGGGHRYSIASEAERAFVRQISSLTESSQLAIRIGTAPLRLPQGYVKWLFESYIPKIKALKYRDVIFERQKKLGRELTDAEHIDIIKEGQNIYGMMNERIFGRSGTVTTLMRFKFVAPSFAEGNFRQELKAYIQWGQKDTFRAGRSRADILNSFLLTAIGATIGTLILTGKPPKKPETAEDIRDLFKIDTGKIDAKGRKLMIDLMTYDKDFWTLFGKPFIGQAGEVPGELFRRLGGMTSTTWDVISDLNQMSMGHAIYDWKEERVVEITDPFAKRVWDLIIHETMKAEPIALNVFGQARDRELDKLSSAIVMLLGFRPTTSEKDRRESQIISRIFSLRDRQERLYYFLGSIKDPRKHIDKYNRIAQGIMDNPVTTEEMRKKWGKNIIIDTERLVSNKVHAYELAKVSDKPKPDEIEKLKKWLTNFDITKDQYRKQLTIYEMKHRKLIIEMKAGDADELLKTEIAKFYADKGILDRKVKDESATDIEKRKSRKYGKISSNISEIGTLIHKTEALDKRKRYYDRIRSLIERSIEQ